MKKSEFVFRVNGLVGIVASTEDEAYLKLFELTIGDELIDQSQVIEINEL